MSRAGGGNAGNTFTIYKHEDLSSPASTLRICFLSGYNPEPGGETEGSILLGFLVHQSRQISRLEVQWKMLSQRNPVNSDGGRCSVWTSGSTYRNTMGTHKMGGGGGREGREKQRQRQRLSERLNITSQ